MKQAIEKMLQPMLNRHYKYGMRIITITGYEINEERERVYISTNEKEHQWDRPFDSVRALLKELTPVTDVAAKNTDTDIVVNNTSNIVDNLRAVLLENIEKVKKDKSYIPQATAINNNVNSIINLSKLQMDALKMSERLKG